MNSTERAYAQRLDRLKREGKIEAYQFERIPGSPGGGKCDLYLSSKRAYQPDFFVKRTDGALEIHETKAMWTERRIGWKGDGHIKFDWAVSLHPNVFVLAALHKDGSWHLEEYNGESATITPEERKAKRSGVHALVARCGKASSRRGASTRRRRG
jgi:hypothetical protein